MNSSTSTSFNKFLQMGSVIGDAELDEAEIASLKWNIPRYQQLGLLVPASPPHEIYCETCDEMAKIFYFNGTAQAACPKCGIYTPPRYQLNLWRVCYKPVIQSLYTGLGCTESTDLIIPNVLWKLGRCGVAGQSRLVYVARGINNPKTNASIIGNLPNNRTFLLLVFGNLPQKNACPDFEADRVFSINSLVSLGEDGLHTDTAPIRETLELLLKTALPKVRGPGKNAKIGDVQIKIRDRLEAHIIGEYDRMETCERLDMQYEFKTLLQKDFVKMLQVNKVMVHRAIREDPYVNDLFKASQDFDLMCATARHLLKEEQKALGKRPKSQAS